MGFIFQNAAYTCTAPIYFIWHLFASPTAKITATRSKPSSPNFKSSSQTQTQTPTNKNVTQATIDFTTPTALSFSSITPDPVSTSILPLCVFLGFGIPTIAMTLPSPGVITPEQHYGWIAIWQLFPVWQSLVMSLLRPVTSARYAAANPREAAAFVYRLILGLTVLSQCTTLLIGLVSDGTLSTVSRMTGMEFPEWVYSMLRDVNLRDVLIPASPFNPPGVDPTAVKVIPSKNWLAPLAVHFLQWDVYCGNFAVLIWVTFLYYVAHVAYVDPGLVSAPSLDGKFSPSFTPTWKGVVTKAVGWFLVGGPVASAAWLMWERDEVVFGAMGRMRRPGKGSLKVL